MGSRPRAVQSITGYFARKIGTMESSYVTLLSLIVFLPSAAALILTFFPRDNTEAMKAFSLAATAVVFLLTVIMALPGEGSWNFDISLAEMQKIFSISWIPAFNIRYYMGVDGISFPLVLITTFICMLSMAASWSINKHVKAYCILFLILETGILGVFLSLDFFLFYVFWEVMLLPMYFLIGVWGGPRREYAAIKFFLYTLLGGVFMLIAILMLYFASDLKQLSDGQLIAAHAVSSHLDAAEQAKEIAQLRSQADPVHTFNILALQQLGQHTAVFSDTILWGKSLQWWAFLLLLLGFVIKVPSVPLHTWLPDAHVEAPTPISMILAGVLLKLGGYGILRICYPICPQAAYDLAYFVCALGVVSMVYGGFAALAQKDFKRLVAYSSVSHMGYVVLGIAVWSLGMWSVDGKQFNADAWKMGVNGAMFQMVAHGISSPGMFFLVGVIYDRVHHRNLNQFGGLFAKMPVYSGIAIGIFFAGLGLPGLCGFIGEVLVTLSAWPYSRALAVVSASVVIITAAYILWTLQRVYLGPEYKGPHGDHLYPMTGRELAIAAPLLALAVILGVYPQAVFRYMTPSVDRTVDDLAAWTRAVEESPSRSVTQSEPPRHESSVATESLSQKD
jgi:NADH-quinone oxidoreductase subunit M